MSSRDNPFETMERMFDQMRRQFDEAARTWEGGGTGGEGSGRRSMGIDLADREEEFVVTADVPGFEKDDIDLRLRDDTLQLAAEREETEERREENYLRSERSRRTMRDRVRLPEPVDEERIEATLRNGVLTVRLPKAEPAAGGHHIEIE